MRLLYWHWSKVHISIDGPKLSRDTGMLVRPQCFHDGNVFIAQRGAFLEWYSEKGEFFAQPTDSHTADNASSRKAIECGQAFRHHGGMPIRQDNDTGPQADTFSACR